MKKLKRIKYLLAAFIFIHGFGVLKAQYEPSGAPALKTFTMNNDLLGSASNSVNLFTGDVALPIQLLSLPGRTGLDLNVGIGYSSQVQQVVDKWNQEAPTGILGLGWSLDLPKIVCDHKQTGTRIDDEYYLVEGGISNKLVRTISGSDPQGNFYVYETLNYQFWRIRYYYDPVEYGSGGSGANKWEIVKEDGTRFIYGDQWSNRKTVQWMVRWGNWIGSSAQTQGQSRLAFVWNLSEIINLWGEKITYEYVQEEQFVGSIYGVKHTEASYISKITNPQGQSIVFGYKDKQHPYFLEPHIEKPEPDAYQEFYEKKYLDFVEVRNQSNAKMLEVSFKYGNMNAGTNAAKMLLTGIVQKNASGTALPGLSFQYFTSGNYKGMLEKVTYPGGGSITYHYDTKTIERSERELAITAPSGYAEPKVWVASDYAVVAWRQLASGGGHTDAARQVKLFAYQWVGEWKGQELVTLSNIHLEGDSWNKDFKDFQVSLQDNHFALLVRSSNSSNNHVLRIWKKSNQIRSEWGTPFLTSWNADDSQVPTLLSGSHFVAAGNRRKTGSNPVCRIFLDRGNSWFQHDPNLPVTAYYEYTAANNYVIAHRRQNGISNFPIYFLYLSEDGKVVEKSFPTALGFTSTTPSYWYSANSFAVCMAGGMGSNGQNKEFAYRWDINYNTFYRDDKDKMNQDLFGTLTDHSPVFIQNNSLVGIYGKLARYDGVQWSTLNISTVNGVGEISFIYGDDICVRPTTIEYYTGNYGGRASIFNPNINGWDNDLVLGGPNSGVQFYPTVGNKYFYFGNGYYIRNPNGIYQKIHTDQNQSGAAVMKAGGPSFDLRCAIGPGYHFADVRVIENGAVQSPITLTNRKFLYSYTKYRNAGIGFQTVVTFNSNIQNIEDANVLYLSRLIENVITGKQTDCVVGHISTNDGLTTRHIAYDYDLGKAVMDPAGITAQYHEVTEIPASQTTANKPFGSIKYFFGNGLTATELGHTHDFSNLQWTGALYKKDMYDASGTLKGYERTVMNVFTKSLVNDISSSVETARYSRPVEVLSLADGIFSNKYIYYANLTGLPTHDIVVGHDSKANSLRTDYKFFWEAYNPARDLNILSPVIQTKQTLEISGMGSVVHSSEATTWKQWNGTNVFGPHKTYSWRRNYSPDFDFANCSNENEPGSYWQKISEVNAVNAAGQVLQVTKH